MSKRQETVYSSFQGIKFGMAPLLFAHPGQFAVFSSVAPA